MIVERDAAYLTDLVHNLRRLPSKTKWVEFKVNQATDPQKIGECLSALSKRVCDKCFQTGCNRLSDRWIMAIYTQASLLSARSS